MSCRLVRGQEVAALNISSVAWLKAPSSTSNKGARPSRKRSSPAHSSANGEARWLVGESAGIM
jgi:hypothetical protein